MLTALRWVVWIAIACVVGLGISWIYYAPEKAVRGVWKTEGYGLIVDVSALRINVYQSSDIHCHHDQTIPAHTWLINLLEGVTFETDDKGMVLEAAGTLNPIYAHKIDALPALCEEETPNSPTMVFDVIWEVMNTHYAHFNTHEVDWAARKALRPSSNPTFSDQDLFKLIQEMLTGLDDGHTYVASDTALWSPSKPVSWHAERHLMRDTTLAAVADLSAPSPTGLRVGWAAPDIGYVYMTHMDVQAAIGQRQSEAATEAFAQIIDYFAQAKGIILDVRYNPGGSDDVALAYAGFFTGVERDVFTKVTRTETGHTAPFTATITPHPFATDVPVVVLTGPYTASAAEIFTMAMRELSQVTTMGMATSGGLSDIMSITLPNGWELGFSHQVYTTLAGESFERVGIPPDIALDVDLTAAQAGTDTILQAAITHLTAK